MPSALTQAASARQCKPPRESFYDYPKYYDLVYGSDWKAEYDFLRACFDRYALRPVWRVFEPACGTGRLLFRLGKAGFDVAGIDLNARAVEYCNHRLARHGLPPAARCGDMAGFRVRRKFDAAFNMINSFRHLSSESQAEGHLRSMAAALSKGGLYTLGLHLTPRGPRNCVEESWGGRRGNLQVNTRLWSIQVDRRRRQEKVGVTYHVYTPTRQFRLDDEMNFRTYTARQFHSLLSRVEQFDVIETFDFAYNLRRPIDVDAQTEDVVYLLRKV